MILLNIKSSDYGCNISVISKNVAINIFGTPPTLLKGRRGGGLGFSETLVAWGGGVRNFLLERGDKPVQGELR